MGRIARPPIRTNSITTRKIFHRITARTMHTRCMFERTPQNALPLVLLIDDDLVSREVTATVLTMNGYTVHTAEDGAAALALLTAARRQAAGALRPDVILMDAQMPGLSGTQLIAELRARSWARIFVVSGSNPPPEVDGSRRRLSSQALRRRNPPQAPRERPARVRAFAASMPTIPWSARRSLPNSAS